MANRFKHRYHAKGPYDIFILCIAFIIVLVVYFCRCLCRKATEEEIDRPHCTQNVPMNNFSSSAQYPRRPRALAVPTVRPAPAQLAHHAPYEVVNECTVTFTPPPPEPSAPLIPEPSAPLVRPIGFIPPATNGSTLVPETPPPTYEQAISLPNSRANSPVPERRK